MTIKIFGAILVILGCSAFGFYVAANRRREENTLRKLVAALDYMECELQYRLSSLPDLCRSTASQCNGLIQTLFKELAVELEAQVSPNVKFCMEAALDKVQHLPKHSMECCKMLGSAIGRFDMNGQMKGLEAVRAECRRRLDLMSSNSEKLTRSYQTLGICAGAALVILLM